MKYMNTSQPAVFEEICDDERFDDIVGGEASGNAAGHAIAELVGAWRSAIDGGWKPYPDVIKSDVNEVIAFLTKFRDAAAADLKLILPVPSDDGKPPHDAATATGMYDRDV